MLEAEKYLVTKSLNVILVYNLKHIKWKAGSLLFIKSNIGAQNDYGIRFIPNIYFPEALLYSFKMDSFKNKQIPPLKEKKKRCHITH